MHNLVFFKSAGTGFNLSASSSVYISISNSSTSDFKLGKSTFLAIAMYLQLFGFCCIIRQI